MELIVCSRYEFDRGWSASQARFYFEVRKLMCCTGMSHRRFASGANISKDAVFRLLKGQHKHGPRVSTLEEFYDFAKSVIDGDFDVIARQDFLDLRQGFAGAPGGQPRSAGQKDAVACPQCGTPAPAELSETAGPGAGTVGGVLEVDAPVPLARGDRRTSSSHVFDIAWPSGPLLWPPATDLAGYLTAGQLEKSNRLIHHVATEADPGEAASAVIACRDLDLPDAVDAIINYAGLRDEREVLQILRPLLRHDRHVDAGALLDRVLDAVEGV
ncbi:hypothetical protein [Nocardia fluminea]|uniref:hypothetical protein n=1 Tax=Nocardia fluminea TaxID=134984 RepID=UPI003D14C128